MPEYGLGRLPKTEDPRDYSVRQLEERIAAGTDVPVSWLVISIMNQKKTGHCVSFGLMGMLNTDDEFHVEPGFTDAQAHAFYYLIKDEEGESGMENGAEVRDGLKVAKAKGWISAYAALKDVYEVTAWLEKHGPVVVGTKWTDDMFAPSADGVVTPTGATAGGHCWYQHGENGNFLESVNSWGKGYGVEGTFKITKVDFAKLLEDGGEAWAVTEAAPAPKPVPDPVPTPKPKKKCWFLRLFGGS